MKTKIAEMNKQQKQFKVFSTKSYNFSMNLATFGGYQNKRKQIKTKKKITSF